MAKKMATKKTSTKISISIDENLLESVNEYCKNNFMTKSGLFAMSVHQFLMQQKTITLLESLTVAMNRVADNGNVDEETAKELESMQQMVNLLVRK